MVTSANLISLSSVLLLGLTASPSNYNQPRITVLFNNVPSDENLTTGWGFSCVIHGMEKTILFDTGSDGKLLLSNMEKLKISPQNIDMVVLSHNHWDHTGGLFEFLNKKAQVTAYLPQSFPQDFEDDISKRGTKVFAVREPMGICEAVYSSGEMGVGMKEQCLILRTTWGLVVITGCAHPGIVDIVRHAKTWLQDQIYLVLGGFHLMGFDEGRVKGIIKELKQMGVKKIAPSHCTGEDAIEFFQKAWGDNVLDGGCGSVISIP